jgi:hypothetical protein
MYLSGLLPDLFDFPESYERLKEIVKTYPANKLDILDATTKFIIRSKDSKRALKIRALSLPSPTSEFENIMDFNSPQLDLIHLVHEVYLHLLDEL